MRCLYDGEHPCGSCPACFANRQRAFMFRLDQEKENALFYFWLTLQYDDEHVPRLKSEEMCFSKKHCREFFEKIRARYKNRFTFKHFLVSEYGPNSTERPHYHCLLLVYSSSSRGDDLSRRYKERSEIREFLITEAWPHGFVREKTFHGRVLRYLTKYCLKPELSGGTKHTMKPFTLISRGIGANFLDSIPEDEKQRMIKDLDFTVRYGRTKIKLPRYYTDKLVPHSLDDLRNAIPEDPSGDWTEYERIIDLRKRMFANNNRSARLRAEQAQRSEKSVEDIRSSIDQRKRTIQTSWQQYRAYCQTRKDL